MEARKTFSKFQTNEFCLETSAFDWVVSGRALSQLITILQCINIIYMIEYCLRVYVYVYFITFCLKTDVSIFPSRYSKLFIPLAVFFLLNTHQWIYVVIHCLSQQHIRLVSYIKNISLCSQFCQCVLFTTAVSYYLEVYSIAFKLYWAKTFLEIIFHFIFHCRDILLTWKCFVQVLEWNEIL